MAITDPEKIKSIIRGNFDRSPTHYEEFEAEYGLFDRLTRQLAADCNIGEGMSVCDVGCGTGASSFALARLVGERGRVLGVDFSKKMLAAAWGASGPFPAVHFVLCDAESLDDELDPGLDAVLYNACIFLIPGTGKTLASARELLKEGGVVGMNFIHGVWERPPADGERGPEGPDLFRRAKEEGLDFAPYGRYVVDVASLPETLEEAGFGDVRGGVMSETMTLEELRMFYSIPAQSTALYPKTPYEERLVLLGKLTEHLEKKGSEEVYLWWGWCAGVK